MGKSVFEDPSSLLGAGRLDLGTTDWFTLEQGAIDAFAEATWVSRSAYKEPAPPMLLLALTNLFLPELLEVRGISSGINYGTGEVRFNAPVRAGDRLRAQAFLLNAAEVPGGVQATVLFRIEIEGSDEPACVVESLSRWMV